MPRVPSDIYKIGDPAHTDLESQVRERVEVAVGAVRTVPQAGVLDFQQHVVGDGAATKSRSRLAGTMPSRPLAVA